MLEASVSKLLNEQVNKELYSAYLYLEFSNFYKEEGLDGYSNWYYIQAQEERDHAMLIMKYLQNNGEKVTLEAIAKPECTLSETIDPLKAGLAHEQYVTSLINAIYAEAKKKDDYRTMLFLNWFVEEQGEEEENAENNLKNYERFGSDLMALYEMDQALKSRTYSAPSLQV